MVKRKRGEAAQEALPVPNGKSARFAIANEKNTTGKSRKTLERPQTSAGTTQHVGKSTAAAITVQAENHREPLSIQVITGSYERVLHGFAATISGDIVENTKNITPETTPTFSDTFLFAAHSSALKSLALSPPTEAHKRILATGSTDERINLFFVSTTPPKEDSKANLPSLSNTSIVENPRNRELGSLLHHSSSVNKLHFPTKGKLFSAADDNTVAISRTRDWTVLSTIKVPIPKAQGRPSGDTAGPGEVPAGVNDFAIHPSMKVMVSVSKGERNMRLWNLVTGKKAGVLNFDRDLLQAVGETRYSSGEGRKVLWSNDGEDYVVGFERGAVVYGMDSVPKAIIRPSPPTKLHQMRFVPSAPGSDSRSILALSTENGRIYFYDIGKTTTAASAKHPPTCPPIAQLGGAEAGFAGRIKDFEILQMPESQKSASSPCFIVSGSSDGAVRIWRFSASEMEQTEIEAEGQGKDPVKSTSNGAAVQLQQIGTLVGTHETGHRITCLVAFVMDGPREGRLEDDDEEAPAAANDSESDSE
ncbi:hypothetical protein MBLNU459_g0294t1 [Dothideomycetes sp. NU459]